ncbi:MAG: DUF177 domain-containing protein [Prevotella sp.]|nr:DUF177 domain-containing protein [Prevotella sp.]MBQ6728680.1 DUF177 domain-containing protein [Bacteroidales bacterium]
MCSLESLKIDLKGQKEGEIALEYDLDDAYFRAIDAPEVSKGRVHVSLAIRKQSGFFELLFHTEGTIIIPCDRCLDEMEQPIKADNRLAVKLGTGYSEDDDLVTIDENEGILDVSWFIYEFIALAIPIKHVHEPGKCNAAMIEALEEHSAARSSDEEDAREIDPRWEALLKLKK